ncbi:6854_t:CDS:2, partial [Paraglomus occultum]
KKLKSRHRILLSGTPVQNDYKELWAIMDFIAPGKFGTLPVFEEEFAKRIKTAGYVNASQLSVRIGYHCARRLAERIKPYMLRRTKEDVKSEFIPKSDEVLFCRLSEEQRLLYSQYLKKDVEMKRLLKIRRLPNERSGAHLHITRLTQICNHPDIYLSNLDRCLTENHGYVYGEAERSGKMIVVKALLAEWEKKGNKVLLFCRSARMLDILETFVSREGYNYRRLDGSTSMHIRDKRINDFNNNENIFVFLLTTQVGGVGLNLVGADRVIIYDPDWNPSTDDQATQRALRYGQTKPVSIYRLMTVGTIEEKIYHRQVFKRALARKVTRKPDFDDIQFEADELHDLFSLGGEDEELTDTRYMFEEAEIRKVRLPKSKKANSDNVSKRLTNGSSALSRESQDELIAVFDYSTNQIIHVRRSTQQEEDLHPPETSDKKEKDIGELLKKLPKIKKKIRSDDPVSGNADLLNGSSVVNNSDASKANGSSSLPNRRKRRRLELFKATEKQKTPTVNNVEGVARVEFRNHSDDEDNKGRDARRRGIDSSSEEEKEEGNDDNHIIQVLYETAGLHSAFNHQRVVRTRGKRSRMSMADIDAVAESVANDANHHLDENADFLARYGPGTLTFTGRNGEAGIPKKSSSSNTAWSLYKKGWNKR